MMDFFEYDIVCQTYSVDGDKIASDCNSIWFRNDGSTLAVVNNSISILPDYTNISGPPVSFAGYNTWYCMGNLFEKNTTQYVVRFFDILNPGVPQNKNKLSVIRKIYKRPDKVKEFMEGMMRGK